MGSVPNYLDVQFGLVKPFMCWKESEKVDSKPRCPDGQSKLQKPFMKFSCDRCKEICSLLETLLCIKCGHRYICRTCYDEGKTACRHDTSSYLRYNVFL